MTKYTVYFSVEKDQLGNKINSVNVRLDTIKSYLSGKLHGFTWVNTTGYWNGVSEKSVKLEIIEDIALEYLKILAKFIKKTLDQECVLITQEKVNTTFV